MLNFLRYSKGKQFLEVKHCSNGIELFTNESVIFLPNNRVGIETANQHITHFKANVLNII